MPFIRKTQEQLDAMSAQQLGSYKAVVEGIFTQVRETVRQTHQRGPCPTEWVDCCDEISAITMTIMTKMMGAGAGLRDIRRMLHQHEPSEGV